MTSEDDLEKLAKAAIAGPWLYSEQYDFRYVLGMGNEILLSGKKDRDEPVLKYAAAANPAAVLALIAECSKLREDMNTKYWEGIRADNIRLEKELKEACSWLAANIARHDVETATLRAVAEAARPMMICPDHAANCCDSWCDMCREQGKWLGNLNTALEALAAAKPKESAE